MSDFDKVRRILDATHTIAIVGASDRSERDSYRVMQYLLKHGFHVLPVNPNARQILGQRCFGSIDEIGEPIDTVVCFRRSEYLEPIARSAVAAHAKHLWMQFGVINERAAEVAEKAGLVVVMDRCIMVDHRRIEGEKALDEPQRAP